MSNCKTSATNISSVERDPVFLSQKGKPGGVATLDASGQVPISQIPVKAMFTERDPIYTADRAQPFGCATLDGLGRVPRNQLGSGVADITTFLRGDGTWALGGGGGGWKQVGSDIVLVTATNRVTVGDVPTFAKLGIRGDVAGDITTAVRAAPGQTASILEIQNSGGSALVAVTAAGNLAVVGNISGNNGTLSGNLSAVNAILSGDVSAVNATLTGNVLLTGGSTAIYIESNDGSTAPVSGAATGRIRYNDSTGRWQTSTQTSAYSDIILLSTIATYAFVQNGNAFGALATLGTTDAFDVRFIRGGSEIARIDGTSLLVRATAPVGTEVLRVTAGDSLLDFTSTTALQVTQTGGGTPTLIVDTTNTRVGIGVAPGAFTLDVAGDTRITGKLTVTGAIDPTSVLLSGGTALYYESNDGSTAPLSGASTGRLRYNNTNGIWQKSTQGGAYIDLMSGSGTAFRLPKWISEAETADGPVESDAGNTLLVPNVDNFLPLGTSDQRFLSMSASDVIGIFLSQGDAEYASELRFDRLAFGIGGNTNPPDVSLRRSGVNTFAISDNIGGGDMTLGVVNNALYIDARNGSNAAVSGASTGRLRYNNTYGYWEQSTLGNPYVPVGDVRDIFRYSMLNNLA